MKRTYLFLSLVFLLVFSVSAFGSPLRLDYSVTNIGQGLFDYEFKLVLDNNDGSWLSNRAQGWRWIIFGDSPSVPSPLEDFVGDTNDLPIGPYTSYAYTIGSNNNGPNLADVGKFWNPENIGDSLSWSGTSAANLGEGELLFSTLFSKGNAAKADFDIAILVRPGQIPEPATLLLFGVGLIGLIGFSRRKFKK